MIQGRLASGYRTVHRCFEAARSSIGTPRRVTPHEARETPSRVAGGRSARHTDDSARALVLRDYERARLAAWAECERRPIANDGFARAALWSRKDV